MTRLVLSAGMADIELVPVIGAIEKGVAYRAEELAGDIFLYVLREKPGHWTYERSELKAGGMFVLMGETGRAANGDDAVAWMQNDWPRLRNYLRWMNYMAVNPPPA